MRQGANDRRQAPLYGLFALLVIGLALAGYLGYVVYPRFDLPASTGIGLLVLSAGAGIASFFSPCSFPLLVTLLARQTGVDSGRDESRASRGRAFVFASALALGTSVFLLLAGFFVALGGGALFQGVTFTSTAGVIIRAVVGAFLILLGLFQIGVLPASGFRAVSRFSEGFFSRAQARQRRKRPFLGFAIFGFGYLLAGFG